MRNEDYLATQDQTLLIANILAVTDFHAFLEQINFSEAAGPCLDPALFLKAQKNLGRIKIIASALSDAREKIMNPLAELQASAIENQTN